MDASGHLPDFLEPTPLTEIHFPDSRSYYALFWQNRHPTPDFKFLKVKSSSSKLQNPSTKMRIAESVWKPPGRENRCMNAQLCLPKFENPPQSRFGGLPKLKKIVRRPISNPFKIQSSSLESSRTLLERCASPSKCKKISGEICKCGMGELCPSKFEKPSWTLVFGQDVPLGCDR